MSIRRPAMNPDLRQRVLEFVASFDRNDLDHVMSFFAEDAEYCPGDGHRHRGKAAIRKAFLPQFEGVYGAMTFPLHDMLVDEAARKVAIRWACRHDFSQSPRGRLPGLRSLFLKNIFGKRFHWQGVDVFHFDEQGLLIGKYSYANTLMPLFHRD